MEERYELKEEEVNVYTAECGKIQEFLPTGLYRRKCLVKY